MSITGPMIAVVKRSSLTPAQKLLWLDLVPYKAQGCHKTARAQAEDIQLSESSVDQWRRLLVRAGLARREEHSLEWGGPRPTWIATFPADLVPPSTKRGFRDHVVRLAAQLDLRILDATRAGDPQDDPTPQWDEPPQSAGPPTSLCGSDHVPMCAEATAPAGGASRGEGGNGGGVALSVPRSKTLVFPEIRTERTSPDGEEQQKTARARAGVPLESDVERAEAWRRRITGGVSA